VNRYPQLVLVFSLLCAGLGIAIIVRTALLGGGVGYLLGALFIGLGVGRFYLQRPGGPRSR
jgi:hypothetical protein